MLGDRRDRVVVCFVLGKALIMGTPLFSGNKFQWVRFSNE